MSIEIPDEHSMSGTGVARIHVEDLWRWILEITGLSNANEATLAALVKSKSWAGKSPTGAGGVNYIGGFYKFGSADWTPSGGPQTFGTVNMPHAAHALVVLGGTSADMIIRVSGTSVTDLGVRTPADTEDIDTTDGILNSYFETTKKWVGQISFSLQSGTSVDVNYGLSKYWDRANTNFTMLGLEALWLANKTDTGFNTELLHHKPTGWTYNAATPPDPPTPIASMNSDFVIEINNTAGEQGAWKRTGFTLAIRGIDGEGLLWKITTSAANSLDSISLEINLRSV